MGKTLLVRRVLTRIQDKIETNQYNVWKHGETPHILVSSLDPSSSTLKLNGLRGILQEVFRICAER